MEFKHAIPNLFSKERHDIVKKYVVQLKQEPRQDLSTDGKQGIQCSKNAKIRLFSS